MFVADKLIGFIRYRGANNALARPFSFVRSFAAREYRRRKRGRANVWCVRARMFNVTLSNNARSGLGQPSMPPSCTRQTRTEGRAELRGARTIHIHKCVQQNLPLFKSIHFIRRECRGIRPENSRREKGRAQSFSKTPTGNLTNPNYRDSQLNWQDRSGKEYHYVTIEAKNFLRSELRRARETFSLSE